MRLSYILSALLLTTCTLLANAHPTDDTLVKADTIRTKRYEGKLYQIQEKGRKTIVTIYNNDQIPAHKQAPSYKGIYRSGKEMERLDKEGWVRWPLKAEHKSADKNEFFLWFFMSFKWGAILSPTELFEHNNSLRSVHSEAHLVDFVYSFDKFFFLKAGLGLDSKRWTWDNQYTLQQENGYLKEVPTAYDQQLKRTSYNADFLSLPVTCAVRPWKDVEVSVQWLPMYRIDEYIYQKQRGHCWGNKQRVRLAEKWHHEFGASISYDDLGLYIQYSPSNWFTNATEMPTQGSTSIGLMIRL